MALFFYVKSLLRAKKLVAIILRLEHRNLKNLLEIDSYFNLESHEL
jgi:hypothetical protein